MIPVYWGKVDETFEKDQCGIFLVQVKAQKQETKTGSIVLIGFNRVTEAPRESRNKLFKGIKAPTILIILNLCVESPK